MTPTIICHRGWWTTPTEQNTLAAFARAFDAGLGVELDVRDCDGGLVVSHDPPWIKPNLLSARYKDWKPWVPFADVIDLLGDRPNVLAVNVKSCGLAPLFAKYKAPNNWFFFDAAPGDEEPYRRHNLPLFKRDVWNADPVLLVSWEILFPGEDPNPYWTAIREQETKNVYLVTDRPAEAMEFFK